MLHDGDGDGAGAGMQVSREGMPWPLYSSDAMASHDQPLHAVGGDKETESAEGAAADGGAAECCWSAGPAAGHGCSCAVHGPRSTVHLLLFAHRNTRLALGMNAAFDVCVPCPILACSCFGRRPFRPSQPVPAAVGIAVAVAVAEGRRAAQRRAPGPKARGCCRRRRRRRRRGVYRVIQTRSHLMAFGTRRRAPCPCPTLACRLTVSLIASLHSSLDVARTPWRRVTGEPASASQRAREPARPPSACPRRRQRRPWPARVGDGRWSTAAAMTKQSASTGSAFSRAASGLLFPRHPHAFPSLSLAYIANLSALTIIAHQQCRVAVPCSNARRQPRQRPLARCPQAHQAHQAHTRHITSLVALLPRLVSCLPQSAVSTRARSPSPTSSTPSGLPLADCRLSTVACLCIACCAESRPDHHKLIACPRHARRRRPPPTFLCLPHACKREREPSAH